MSYSIDRDKDHGVIVRCTQCQSILQKYPVDITINDGSFKCNITMPMNHDCGKVKEGEYCWNGECWVVCE